MVHDMIADAFGAVAYIAMVFAIWDLFAATGSSVERRHLAVVTAVLLEAVQVLQIEHEGSEMGLCNHKLWRSGFYWIAGFEQSVRTRAPR